MRRYSSNQHPGFSSKVLLLLVLLASGGGPCHLALGQPQGTKVTELTEVIGARFHVGPMAFSPDGKSLALPKLDEGQVELWSLETGKKQVLFSSFNKDRAPARHVAFSKDGRFLAVDYQNTGVTLWDLPSKKEQAHIPVTRPSWVDDMSFADDDRTFVTIMSTVTDRDIEGPGPSRWNHSAVRWEVSTGKKQVVHVFDPFLLFKALSPDGRHAVLQNEGGQTVFDLVTGKRAFATDSDGGFLFSEDSSTLVSYDGDQMCVWDVPSGKESRRFAFQPGYTPTSSANHLALSPDKKVLAVGWFTESHVVGLISLQSGKVLGTFECSPAPMICEAIRFSPDGRIFATDTQTTDGRDRVVRPLLRFWKIHESW
jgi:WD40 repeat protein